MIDGGAPHDLLFLQENRCIKVVAKGKNITRLEARLTNLVETPLEVVIHPGTYFVADGAHQDMVVIEKVRLRLPPGASYDLTLRVACMRAERSVPRAGDRFGRIAAADDDLRCFLEASGGLPSMAIQAGVWALTDRYARADVRRRLTIVDLWGRVSSAVTDEDLDQAARVLDELWIPHGLGHRGRGEPGGAPPLIVPAPRETGEDGGAHWLPGFQPRSSGRRTKEVES